MLPSQQSLSLSPYASLYDLIIPKDNILRKINDLVDFSFVHDELINKYCLTNGRTAESPIKLFKYLLLKNIYDISDAAVVERSRFDMSFKYFLDMAPEDDVINPSTLTKFRKLRLSDTDLLKLLIAETVRLAISKEIIKSKAIIVDATHTASRSNPFSATEALKMRSRQLRKALYDVEESIKSKLPVKNEDNDLDHELAYSKALVAFLKQNSGFLGYPKVQEKFEMLEETLEDIQERYTLSKDRDARIGHKSEDTKFFGYKTHIAMSKERIITSAVVTSGEKGDGPILPTLVEDSIDNGMPVDTIIG
ncbi:transposase, partial [Myroides sp. LJL115]